MSLAKWAAPVIPVEKRKPLRFNVNDQVSIRIQDNKDGYEQWVSGTVMQTWSVLPGPRQTQGLMVSAEAVPYKVVVDKRGAFYCHRDDHTLIRDKENAPKTLGKSIAKRFETRTRP